MTDPNHLQRIQERIRAAQKADAQDATSLPDAADELFASLEDGVESFAGSDEVTLGATLDRYGFEDVSQALRAGASERSMHSVPVEADKSSEDGQILGGAHWFQRPMVLAAAAAVLLGGLLYVQFKRPGATPAMDDVQVAWAELDADRLVLEDGAFQSALELVPATAVLDWRRDTRGASDELSAAVRRRGVVVHVAETFGAGVLIDDDGHVLTSSQLVSPLVQAAAWDGELPVVEIELVQVDDAGDVSQPPGRLRCVLVRHRPDLGMSVLRLEDPPQGMELVAAASLSLTDAAPGAGDPVAILSTSPSGVAVTLTGEIGAAQSHAEMIGGIGGQFPDLSGALPALVRVIEGVNYRSGSLGSPVFTGTRSADVRLTGMVIGGTDLETWVAGLDAVREVLTSLPDTPERYPLDPWFLPLNGFRELVGWDAEGRLVPPVLVARVERQEGREFTAFFIADGPEGLAGTVPSGLPGGPAGGTRAFDLVVLFGSDGRVAVGVTSGGVLDRIWAGRSADGRVTAAFERDVSGAWRALDAEGRSLGDGAWLGETNARLLSSLEEALGR